MRLTEKILSSIHIINANGLHSEMIIQLLFNDSRKFMCLFYVLFKSNNKIIDIRNEIENFFYVNC